ncbi:type 4a pilus biogenesis protein PilO [Deinococcus radiopugnans]|uniref:Pilus assembly protein PilO n=1 Tax=Deinococcus radiopugnans ATCC 19172 TaxID=585398 RepID=A0A5C4Y7U2_9DEIO|nr:type 4a pilus biogenesis protein PilO [Deinococcus radiopugnans]MBB6014970.1 type IV pilus assembly protein PilO [Deinococcus radiopugnans ATCC 19172]TNM71621.1 pilus assembly protein PilO [Deinococcus radiopugnans ATCC 19172]
MSTKLSPRNLFLIVLAVCLMVLALWFVLRFQPRQQQITDLQGQLEPLQTRVTVMRSASQGLPALRERVAELRTDQQEFLTALPSAANFGSVLDELRRTTAATGATLNTFTVQGGGAAPGLPGGVRPIGLNVGVTGKFAQMFETLRALETAGRFTTVSNVALQLPAATSFDPELEGTLGLTVYTFDPAQASASAPGSEPQAPEAAPSAPGGTQ